MIRKIAAVSSSFSTGGAERQAAFAVLCLAQSGYDVTAIAVENRTDFLPTEVAVRNLGKRSRWDIVRMVAASRRLLADSDLVLAFGWYAALLCVLAGAGKRCVVRFGTSVARLSTVQRAMAAWTVRRCLGVVATTSGVAAELHEVLSAPRSFVAVIRNSVPVGWTENLPQAQPPSRRYMVCVARLDPVKRHLLLLEAFATVAGMIEHDLVLVGDGPLRAEIELAAASLGVSERVHFLGFMSDPRAVIAAADFCVLSSSSEGYGSVLIESVALGVPFVATDVPYGPREIAALSDGGLLVAPDDAEALAKGILTMSMDGHLRQTMSERCAARAREVWAPDIICARWSRLVEECASLTGASK